MFKKYDIELKNLLTKNSGDTDWEKALDRHRLMLTRITHERLIHLLVTLFVGFVMSITFYAAILSENVYMVILGIPLLVLFVFYLLHYRFLENTTQKWYGYEDQLTQNEK